MTHERDLERLLDSWFAEGPLVVADRVIDDTTDRIARQPQRPAWRLRLWRFPTMSMRIRIAVVVGALVVAALASGVLSIGGGSQPPSRSVSVPPSFAPAGSGVAPSDSAAAIHCEDDLPGCTGPLAAGSHGSAHFAPRLIHYETPEGWTNSIDTSTIYKLDAPNDAASILIWTDVSFEDQRPTSCEAVAKSGGTNFPKAADWLTYLQRLPGLVTHPVKFDFTGSTDKDTWALDIAVDPAWTQACPGRQVPEVLFIAHTAPPRAAYGVRAGDRVRLIVFDTTSYGDHTVLVEIYGPGDDARFAQTMRVVQPVLDSFAFGCGPSAGYGPCSGYASSAP